MSIKKYSVAPLELEPVWVEEKEKDKNQKTVVAEKPPWVPSSTKTAENKDNESVG